MIVRVLGSAAGGGFPQWNCACSNCRGFREGLIHATPRTQESVCLSADGTEWFLINASPDICSQIESYPALHPRSPRVSPIQAIFLTNGDLDHCLGLLSLRENHPIVVYATDAVRRGFVDGNVLYRTLQRFPDQIAWRTLKPGVEETVLRADGRPSGLTVKAVAVPGKLPVHLEGVMPADQEMNVALRFGRPAGGRTLAYLSAVGMITPAVHHVVEGAGAVFFDGTFWSSAELSAQGLMNKSAEELAHWPIGGPNGSLDALSNVAAPRRVFIHLNNTNPILRDDSPEREMVTRAGWEVAFDGMEFTL
jgi:pyrroloquinoline quinone biosynthesis protein B